LRGARHILVGDEFAKPVRGCQLQMLEGDTELELKQ
jgi:hypothetical protein